MIAHALFIPILQSAGAWTVQFGPWSLPPVAWMPATAVIGALALRTRARALSQDRRPEDSAGPEA
jgi:hypothetical protein